MKQLAVNIPENSSKNVVVFETDDDHVTNILIDANSVGELEIVGEVRKILAARMADRNKKQTRRPDGLDRTTDQK